MSFVGMLYIHASLCRTAIGVSCCHQCARCGVVMVIYTHIGVVPQWQMTSLMKICDAEAEDKHLEPFVVEKFKVGQLVRVKDGPFAGVEGIVKRYKGQQRIGIVVDGLSTITTAYIAKDKLEVLEITKK